MDSTITSAISAILDAERPVGLDASVSIVTEVDTARIQHPYLLIYVDAGTNPHPLMFAGTVMFDLRTSADTTPPATAAAWLQAVTDWFTENSASVMDTLPLYGLRLMLWTKGASTAAPGEDRKWQHTQAWNIAVRRA